MCRVAKPPSRMDEGGDAVDASYRTMPSQAVVAAVAEREGIPVEELGPPEYEPLHTAVDPVALDDLFADPPSGRGRSDGSVSFTYCGHDVTVDARGTVRVE